MLGIWLLTKHVWLLSTNNMIPNIKYSVTHVNYKKKKNKKRRVLMDCKFSWEDEVIYLIAMSQIKKKINPQRKREVSIIV